MASKADQKNEARLKREQAQAAAAAAQKRNRNLQVLAGVIFAALLVVVLVVVFSGGKDTPDGGAGQDADAEVAGIAETKTLLDGIEQNGLDLGDPKAPITVIEFLDVQCPFCRDHELDEQPTIIKELVRTGKAKLRIAPVALPQMGEDSVAGRVVTTRLAEQGKAWNFVNLFYFNQGNEATGYVTNDYLKKLVAAIPGTKASDADRTSTPEIDAKLAEVDKLQTDLNVTGTPSFAIGKSSADPSSYKLVDLSGASSNSDAIIDAVNELAKKDGV